MKGHAQSDTAQNRRYGMLHVCYGPLGALAMPARTFFIGSAVVECALCVLWSLKYRHVPTLVFVVLLSALCAVALALGLSVMMLLSEYSGWNTKFRDRCMPGRHGIPNDGLSQTHYRPVDVECNIMNSMGVG